MLVAAALVWLFATESGLRWALALAEEHANGTLRIEGARGTLRSVVTIDRLAYETDGTRIEARMLGTHAHLAAALGGRLVLEPLRIGSLDIAIGEGGARASSPPLMPFGVRIGALEIDELRVSRREATYTVRNLRFPNIAVGPGSPPSVAAEGSFELAHERFPLTATVSLGGNLERPELRATIAQGETQARVRALLAPFRSQHIVELEAQASPVDLARLAEELPHAALALELKVTGDERALRGSLALTNASPGPLDQRRLPVASAQARISSTDLENATLEELRIVLAGGGVLEGRGQATSSGVRATVRASRINLRALRSTLRETELSGPLDIAITSAEQSVRGTLAQPGMSVTADVVRAGNIVDVRSLDAAAAGGEVKGGGKIFLGEPLRFEARLMAAHFDPAAFGDYPRGSISGSVDARGELAAEPRIELEWKVDESTLVELPLRTQGRARLAGRRLVQGEAEATLGSSRASARGSFGAAADKLAWTLQVGELEEHLDQISGRLSASGELSGTWQAPQARISARVEGLEVHGYAIGRASADISGTPARHEARFAVQTEQAQLQTRLLGAYKEGAWSGEIASLEGKGKVPVTLRAPARLKFARGRVELGRVDAALGEGRLLVHEFAWSRTRTVSSGEFSRLPAQWLIAAAGVTDVVRATLLLDGQWSINAAPALDGMLRLRRASGDIALLDDSRAIDLGLSSIALDARFTDAGVGMRLDLVSRYATAAIGGQLGRDRAAGALGLGRESPLILQGQIELSHARVLAQPVLPDARFDGRVTADVQAAGTLGKPVFSGAVRGDSLSFDYPPYGVYLKNGEFRAQLDGDTLRVERFNIDAGEGRFSASGTLPLRFADGDAKLTWQAKNFAVLERPDMRLVASGEGEAGFDGKRLSLTGELRAERGHLELERERMPHLGDDVVIAGEPRASAQQKGPLPITLNVDLDLGSNLTVRAQGLEGKLTGRINIATSKDGELRAFGKLSTLNATFFAYGQRLQVDPGIVIFDGPIDNPTLQITAWRRNQAVEAGVQVSGTVRAPRVQIVSQPQVSEGERLSWLVLGRAPTDANKADLGLLQAAAGALLARGNSMPLDRRIAQSFGLDEVSFRGTGELQDRVLAFGKRLSDRLYVSYEQGLGTVASNLVKIDYSLSRRWSLRAETGTSSGGGLFYRFSWD
ncbi:MAG: translocation/assembly module TamB domain-containing protein [Burkholderiales bacterium]